jgi:hypothetical protein
LKDLFRKRFLMPDRYHIHTVQTPDRFHRAGKYGGIDWREDCARCTDCVKPRCNFDVYEHEAMHNRNPYAAIQTLNECRACFSCVQSCTKGLLSLSLNPEFLDMGDEYWKPDMILSTWNQAESGRIPVSGAGYRGPFYGPGFDSIWTDMSEIVRPTRDGIHGREYIATSVDIGPKPMRLSFTPEGKMLTEPSRLLELQLPAILDIPAWPMPQIRLAQARAAAAKNLKTMATMFARDARKISPELLPFTVPILGIEDIRSDRSLIETIGPMAQLIDGPDLLEMADLVHSTKPQTILSARMTLEPTSADRIVELSARGLKVFHLCADLHGCERIGTGTPGRHIKDVLREIHGRLVDEGFRDEITLIISGGIALAEHMAKAIICGADLVAVDTALLIALGCRVCSSVRMLNIDGGLGRDAGSPPCSCPAEIGPRDGEYAVQRMTNLMGAWHSQLIEVLGAMGIREIRRLRGEMGRAIFMEEIEKEAFGDLLQVSQEREIA